MVSDKTSFLFTLFHVMERKKQTNNSVFQAIAVSVMAKTWKFVYTRHFVKLLKNFSITLFEIFVQNGNIADNKENLQFFIYENRFYYLF